MSNYVLVDTGVAFGELVMLSLMRENDIIEVSFDPKKPHGRIVESGISSREAWEEVRDFLGDNERSFAKSFSDKGDERDTLVGIGYCVTPIRSWWSDHGRDFYKFFNGEHIDVAPFMKMVVTDRQIAETDDLLDAFAEAVNEPELQGLGLIDIAFGMMQGNVERLRIT